MVFYSIIPYQIVSHPPERKIMIFLTKLTFISILNVSFNEPPPLISPKSFLYFVRIEVFFERLFTNVA